MGQKKVLESYQIITAAVMTGTTAVDSTIMNIKNTDNFGIRVSWTGTAVGTITVQCSVDGTNFESLTFNPTLTQPAGTAGSYLIDLNQVPFLWVKVHYVNASGTGVLNAWICGKDIN